ncbi:glycosyltransferase [Fontivita pretiosa]|uniref:glycosyltransferase n=1 Tax=Fontivita pretiosa TaxID=2989684 RepID=UPI003D17E6E7
MDEQKAASRAKAAANVASAGRGAGLRVLLVHNFYQQPGGEDQVFAAEARLLESRGHVVARFTMDNDAIEGMGRLELAGKTLWNRAAQQSLRQAIQQIRADVVHFHNTFPLISPAAYYTAHEQGAAVVQTLHNYRLLCPAATFYREGHVCEQCLGRTVAWPAVVYRCYRGSRSASAVVAGMLASHRLMHTWREQVDIYIALTQFARNKLIEGGLPADRILVKPNFVDPDPGPGDGHGGYALFVGRLTEEKGIRTLLESWKSLYARAGVRLRIVGDGPMRQQVIQQAHEQEGIEYMGRRAPEEVYGMMGEARALIFPSIWYEGLPRTIIESFAVGTPVVASRLGSMAEVVDAGRTGMLFAPGNGKELTSAMEELVREEGRYWQMRQSARLEYQTRYTAEVNYPTLLECYEAAVARLR